MKAKVVRIGSSRGVRVPKALIAQAGLGNQIEITVHKNQIILRALSVNPREGWDEAFRKALAAKGQEEPDEKWQTTSNRFDDIEWTW